MLVAFWDNSLSERGTSVALYDYALGNEQQLGNRSLVLYDGAAVNNNQAVIAKFRAAFGDRLVACAGFAAADAAIASFGADTLYVIKSGDRDGKLSRVCRTAVHCVFTTRAPHGDVYAAISPAIVKSPPPASAFASVPVVPHIVSLPQLADPVRDTRMRERHGISASAVVFGRYGGAGQFDISYVRMAVAQTVLQRPDAWFVFVNTMPFFRHPRVLFLPPIVDTAAKLEYIDGCDAMLWGRSDGETFGLAIAEFSVRCKPVFVTRSPVDNAHLDMLGDRALYYDESTIARMLLEFQPAPRMPDGRSWNAYELYTPERVMPVFDQVFLQ